MRMILGVEDRATNMIGDIHTTICGMYVESSGITVYGAPDGPAFDQFIEILRRARQLVLEMARPVYRAERSVILLGELPTRVAEFYRKADKLPYRCEPGKSRLASLITAYLDGQDIPVEAIWDYIQENVLTA